MNEIFENKNKELKSALSSFAKRRADLQEQTQSLLDEGIKKFFDEQPSLDAISFTIDSAVGGPAQSSMIFTFNGWGVEFQDMADKEFATKVYFFFDDLVDGLNLLYSNVDRLSWRREE
jgi:hypothetical protein